MHRSLSLGLLVTLALAAAPACNRSDATPPSRTVREATTTSSTSTTTLEQSYEVPEVIDEAYVNRVLAALDEIYGDVARQVLTTRQLAPDDLVPLRAIFNDPLFAEQADGFALLTGANQSTIREPVGHRRTVTTSLLAVSTTCIHAEVTIDISAVVVDPPPPRRAYLELQRTQADADPHGINPTPWSMSNEDQEAEPRCAS